MASKDLAPMMVKGRQLDQNNMNSGGMLRCFRQFSANLPPWLGTRSPVVLKVASYRSQYSLDFLYPTSNRDFVSNPGAQFTSKLSNNPEEFSGYIPIDKVTISHTKSSGPGGQNVNKVNSKVEVRFHVNSAEWIPAWIREHLLHEQRSRINKDGVLIVTSEKTRKQMLNQADCMDKIRTMIFDCSRLPREPTEEEVKLKEDRINKAKKGILLEKRQNSLKKQNRQPPTAENV